MAQQVFSRFVNVALYVHCQIFLENPECFKCILHKDKRTIDTHGQKRKKKEIRKKNMYENLKVDN